MFTEEMFQEALRRPRLMQPIPKVLTNRAEPVQVMDEKQLQAMTDRWFDEYEAYLAFYAKHGIDLAWTLDWAKKYWWSWQARDMSYNDELYTQDLRYTDVTSMGATIVGLDEFVAYNFAFFDAIPDWRYDPIPGQFAVSLHPSGTTTIMIRYYGSGHLVGPLKLHPYTEDAASIPGNGAFVQFTATDRYHFTPDGRMYEGDTLYDALGGMQVAGLLPHPNSKTFKAGMRAAGLATKVQTLLTKRTARARGVLGS
ncbi:MAG: ester cyclase [Nocardiaceae bacterium]|nr:ester cyclase [Nocardiaceae bacterium]